MRLDPAKIERLRELATSVLSAVQTLEALGDLDPTWAQDPGRADGYLDDAIAELADVDSTMTSTADDLADEMIP